MHWGGKRALDSEHQTACFNTLGNDSAFGQSQLFGHEQGRIPKGVIPCLSLSIMPGVLGETSPVSQQSHKQVAHREGETDGVQAIRASAGGKYLSLTASAGVGLKPGGTKCGPWYSQAPLLGGAVGALSSCSPPGLEVPLILVSRWSPYSTVQTCGLGSS